MEIPTPRDLLRNAREQFLPRAPEKKPAAKRGRSPARKKISQNELQQSVQRLAAECTDRILQSIEDLLPTAGTSKRLVLEGRALLYSAALLDIATGPSPEANFLDLMTFLRLSRRALREYWIPEVLGEEAAGIEASFARSEAEVRAVAEPLMTEKQRKDLDGLIEHWAVANPHQVRVEGTRFTEYSHFADGARGAKTANGLLGSLHAATSAADRALLLGERSLYFAQRAPFVMRLQMLLGIRQSADEVLRSFLPFIAALVGIFAFRLGKSLALTPR